MKFSKIRKINYFIFKILMKNRKLIFKVYVYIKNNIKTNGLH